MATMATAVRDIHATSPRDTLTGVAARSVPVTKSHPHPLPTPPNSISPALPPHGLRAQLQKAKLEPIDSDLDLQEGGHAQFDTAANGQHPGSSSSLGGVGVGVGSPPYDSAGVISPALLAKHHLPEILLNHGPLAIRHIMGYLTTSVPGFAGIPPAKARRLVVGALEGRGSGGEGGGLDGDVEFEKVGWGRWDARRRGQPPRRGFSPPAADGDGIPISKGWDIDRSRLHATGGSSVGESAAFSHDDYDRDHDITMLENEADKMSMDGSASASCSEAPDDDVAMNDDPEDVTDDEDWAAVGAVALRAASYSNPVLLAGDLDHAGGSPLLAATSSSVVYTSGGGGSSGGSGRGQPGLRSVSYNAGMARPPQLLAPPHNTHNNTNGFDASAAFGGGVVPTASDAQEREAIEALLSLGSV